MFQYQRTQTYFAQIADGFEEIAARELESLGAGQIKPAYRGVYFQAEPAQLYAVNYQARLVTRILAPLVTFTCKDRNDLYQAGVRTTLGCRFQLLRRERFFA